MEYNQDNIHGVKIADIQGFKIKILSVIERRGSGKTLKGSQNCSGYNINKHIHDGMTIAEYQDMVRMKFDKDDPQFSISKHLRYDIKQGHIKLVK